MPPILFGIGNKDLLSKNHIGIVGSRNIAEQDIETTKNIVSQLNEQGYGVVSGGARGIDEHSMTGILQLHGHAIGVLADSLIKKSAESLYREFIMNNQLVLISPYNPEAGFNVGNAMGRNKLIYLLSKATIVVKSETKGGTWEGANENLKNKWVPLWIAEPADAKSGKGNFELVKKGGKWLPQQFKVSAITQAVQYPKEQQGSLFGYQEKTRVDPAIHQVNEPNTPLEIIKKSNPSISDNIAKEVFFNFFIDQVSKEFTNQEFQKEDLVKTFNLNPKQVDEWLQLAVGKELVIKKLKPGRFVVSD